MGHVAAGVANFDRFGARLAPGSLSGSSPPGRPSRGGTECERGKMGFDLFSHYESLLLSQKVPGSLVRRVEGLECQRAHQLEYEIVAPCITQSKLKQYKLTPGIDGTSVLRVSTTLLFR
jgi:hypothetical protein